MYKGELAELRGLKSQHESFIWELQETAKDALKSKDYKQTLEFIATAKYDLSRILCFILRKEYVPTLVKYLNSPNPQFVIFEKYLRKNGKLKKTKLKGKRAVFPIRRKK